MELVLEILEELNLDTEEDLSTYDRLVDDGILASLDLVTIIAELGDTFDITIPAREIRPENFNSASAMLAMVERLQDE